TPSASAAAPVVQAESASVEIRVRITKKDDGTWIATEAGPLPKETSKTRVSREQYSLSRASLMTEILKSLLLVNGGGAAVLLTLLKDLTATRKYESLISSAVSAAVTMAIGLLLAVASA